MKDDVDFEQEREAAMSMKEVKECNNVEMLEDSY